MAVGNGLRFVTGAIRTAIHQTSSSGTSRLGAAMQKAITNSSSEDGPKSNGGTNGTGSIGGNHGGGNTGQPGKVMSALMAYVRSGKN